MDSRAKFEAFVMANYDCNGFDFGRIPLKRGGPCLYCRTVWHKSLSGRLTSEGTSLQMLWEAWEASREAHEPV